MIDLFPPARRSAGLFGALLAFCLAGCGDPGAMKVRLESQQAKDEPLTRLEIQAQTAGPVEGLEFKWFALMGECQPQESSSPKTIFTFAEGNKRDRVSVEVWRAGRRVAQSDLEVRFDEERARAEQERTPSLKIQITTIPPSEQGGPDTKASISGLVTGEPAPDARVAIYARAYGSWHIQPFAHDLHEIRPDNTWTSWTHTGSSYAALVVRKGYNPLVRLDALPDIGGFVMARTIVDGASK